MTRLPERGQTYMAPRSLPTVRGFEQLDRLLHAFEPRLTAGISPAALMGAGLDWFIHLLNGPGSYVFES